MSEVTGHNVGPPDPKGVRIVVPCGIAIGAGQVVGTVGNVLAQWLEPGDCLIAEEMFAYM